MLNKSLIIALLFGAGGSGAVLAVGAHPLPLEKSFSLPAHAKDSPRELEAVRDRYMLSGAVNLNNGKYITLRGNISYGT